jgi:hypothetical protein
VAHYNKELPDQLKPPLDMQRWRQQKQEPGSNNKDYQLMALLSREPQVAKSWVHGVLAWVGTEMAVASPKKVRWGRGKALNPEP